MKQTVMTSVYGVTYIGARDQIKRRLKERGITEESDIFGCSCYAARCEGSIPTVMIHNSLALLFFIKHVTDNILYCCLIR